MHWAGQLDTNFSFKGIAFNQTRSKMRRQADDGSDRIPNSPV